MSNDTILVGLIVALYPVAIIFPLWIFFKLRNRRRKKQEENLKK